MNCFQICLKLLSVSTCAAPSRGCCTAAAAEGGAAGGHGGVMGGGGGGDAEHPMTDAMLRLARIVSEKRSTVVGRCRLTL